MKNDTIIDFQNPVKDALTEFLKTSAQKMLQAAIEQEVEEFLLRLTTEKIVGNKARVVRNGYLPERDIQTGIGNVTIKVSRVWDRGVGRNEDAIKFYPNWIPKYLRRTASLDSLLPLLYLKGISTGDFGSVLEPILGKDAANLSPSVISKLKSSWFAEYQQFASQDLRAKQYVYFWADGIYLEARMEDEKSCVLVIIGADHTGKKELVAIVDAFRESKLSWRNLLLDLKARGLEAGPKLAIGDGALGFWGALSEVYPATKWQRCWVHKARNILDKLPKNLQAKAKAGLHDIYNADTRANAEKAMIKFMVNYGLKYPKAVECLLKDKDSLLAFYSFPAEHWQSIRTTNPIESTFATVRHRTIKSKGCFSRATIMASVYKLICAAEQNWKKLYGHARLADVINLVPFIDGIAIKANTDDKDQNAA